MKIHQLSLFLENRPGQMTPPCRVLADAGIGIHTLTLADRPGGLAGLLELFDGSGINIEYMYAFTFGREDKAVLIFRFDQPDAAIEHLRAAGINVVEDVELYHRIHV